MCRFGAPVKPTYASRMSGRLTTRSRRRAEQSPTSAHAFELLRLTPAELLEA